MARGRKPWKRANKTVKLSLPKKLYFVLYGIAGNNEQKMNKLIKSIRATSCDSILLKET